ncbi:hypothetical protein [Pseudobutyrivibrio xylanivorans]|uniref:Uncharacterized protein n=1 Tax=Pseudobutyrivibrio xylanivorans TaxID=185007 RepID=A0A5P6VRX8_PSEXY|nr:hypothetical protein [Pseudobutyrivibrio xylanivorans]QFJ55445.1 hypothetical protein FXF36_11490 [Pseudobutyrivibrio xylanivorans]
MNIVTLKPELERIKDELEKIDALLSNFQEIMNYRLVVKKGNGYFQYWYRDEENKLIYIPAKEKSFAKELVQKDYYLKVKKTLLQQKRTIETFISQYDAETVYNLTESYCIGKKALLDPMYKNNEEFIQEWLELHIGNQNTMEYSTSYPTDEGGLVRSKSEKILADLFFKHGIPYQYESEFKLHNGWNCYPDFVLLNVRERKTFYWEHFGLASSKDYADKNLEKLAKYEKSGIVLGDNLIVSFESAGVSLDVKLAEEKIRKYLL